MTKPAAPMTKAKVRRPPGTMGLVAGGRQLPEYRSDHAIAAGRIPNRTSTAQPQPKTPKSEQKLAKTGFRFLLSQIFRCGVGWIYKFFMRSPKYKATYK